MTQLDLPLTTRKQRKRVGPKLAARMIAILSKCEGNGWLTRKQFSWYTIETGAASMQTKPATFTDRACRLGRECSHGRIIRGQRGYKLLRRATQEEYAESMGAWTKQIQAEQEQYSMTAKRWHKGLDV